MQVVQLTLLIPLFNEVEAIAGFLTRIGELFDSQTDVCLEILFVNDGSNDETLSQLLKAQISDQRIRIVDLSRHFGKEAALSAGLAAARGDVVVPIDVDLQDPPELIFDMLEAWRQGFEVVLAKRVDRNRESWLKRTTAQCFYRLHNRIADVKIPENVGDFRLMDRRVIEVINHLPESRRFMKGLFAWAGFRTTTLVYMRAQRSVGESRFTGKALLELAAEGLLSFSTAPLRLWLYIGSVLSLLSVFFAVFIVLKVLLTGVDVPGYASIVVAVTLIGGVQLIGIGLLGEYLSRTYIESKRRPPYVVRDIYDAQ